MTMVVGIDPGQKCGIAVYEDGEMRELFTVAPHELLGTLRLRLVAVMKREKANVGANNHSPLMAVIYEDSRLQSFLWNARGKHQLGVALKAARNVGMVDAICAQIAGWCEDEGVRYYGVSPKDKGAKLDAEAFKNITGWTARSNQHERDAALVAWPYRRIRAEKLAQDVRAASFQQEVSDD